MAITDNTTAFVNATSTQIALSQMFTTTANSSNPAYLVLTALDRNEYTAGASGATGTLVGNGNVLNLSSIGEDGRGAGIVFAYQASTGRYYNSTYGYLDQLMYDSSGSANDVTNLSLFATGNLTEANDYAANAYDMMQIDPSGYIGSATVATQTSFTATVPGQATPGSIIAAADSFVGKAWTMDGCWVLASTIAAEAGASLAVQSTAIGVPGQANGEWIVAYNGPAGASGKWQSMVKAGEIIVIGTSGGGGHITTCVSGSGSSAMLVDNITYENGYGQILNPANDGSADDIIVSAPHAASQEWSGVSASSVVIYELDTPTVTASISADSLVTRCTQSLGSLFSATDPAGKTIAEWQVYDTSTADALILGGTDYADHSAASALAAASLASVSLLAGSAAGSDVLEVRAYNGSYWGDWTSLAVAVTAATPPVLKTQTAAQIWVAGKSVSLALPVGTFADPQNEALIYAARLSNSQALPTWLSFNATTRTFSGTAPATLQTFGITVTATDTSGRSVSETFQAAVVGAPTVTTATANQTWTEGKAISFALPGGTFTDPQGQKLTYAAKLSNGAALPSWLTLNATTGTFAGTAPATAQSLGITVTATDTSGLSASESFTASIEPAASGGIAVSAATAALTWVDGQAETFVVPAAMFTDTLGLQMTFAAYEAAGPNDSAWLHFNAAQDELYGTAPAGASGTVQIAIIATDTTAMTAEDLFILSFAPTLTGSETAPSLSLAAAVLTTHVSSLIALHT